MAKCLSENDIFKGKKAVTINAEIPDLLNQKLYDAYLGELDSGNMSLTFEQYVGGIVNLGFSWATYSQLKKVFA